VAVPSSFFSVHDMPHDDQVLRVLYEALNQRYSTQRHSGKVSNRPELTGGIACNLICCRSVTQSVSGSEPTREGLPSSVLAAYNMNGSPSDTSTLVGVISSGTRHVVHFCVSVSASREVS
jgi:hypothetical protein